MDKLSDKYWVLLIYLALALTTLAVFWQVRDCDFVNYDDDVYVTENWHVKGGITSESIGWAFTAVHGGNWHPLTWLSHMLDCEIFGLSPFWHHLTNLFFHIANTLLLFWVFKRMTGAAWPSAFVAAAFALHPLHVESVAWVSERKDVLSGFFWMLTIAAYVRYAERPDIRRFVLVVLAFCLGLMAKPMLVTLPFVLLLLDYWPLGRFQWGHQSGGEALSQCKTAGVSYQRSSPLRLVMEKIPLFVPAAVSSVVTFIVQQDTGANLPLSYRIANAAVSYISYIGKMIYPSRLAVLYPYPTGGFPKWQPTACFVILVGVTVAVIYMSRRRYLAVGWLWYLGTLVPVIGLVQVGVQAMADRYTYLPLIGIFIMIAWGAAEVGAKWRYRKIGLGILAGIVLALLLICTRMQVRHWQNNLTLYEHTLVVTEKNCVIHNNYGVALFKEAQLDEALAHFNEALRINPGYFMARINLGNVFLARGKVNEAIACFNNVLSTKTDLPDVYSNLGLAYFQLGRYELAIQNFNEALRLKPDYPKAINNWVVALKEQGKISEAIKKWEKALELKPDYPNAHYSMGLAMAEQGEFEKAIAHYNKAIMLKPDWDDPRRNLQIARNRKSQIERIARWNESLRENPNQPQLHNILGTIFHRQGDVEKAIYHWKKALELKPDRPDVLNNLAWLLAAKENSEFSNPDEAIRLAERACELSEFKRPELVDTLAVAYAAASRFGEAVETAEKALVLAESANQQQLAEAIKKRLELYKTGRH